MVDFQLDGNSEADINAVATKCLLGVAAVVALGFALDVLRARWRLEPEVAKVSNDDSGARDMSISIWAISLLLASYALLVPGLCSVLFSFNVMLDFGLLQFGLGPGGGLDKAPATTESMVGLVHLLRSTDCSLGATAVVLYAMVVPGLKVFLLLLGELLRRRHAVASSLCIHLVQSISKWACPDMFAYILLTYLVRGLNHPRMLQADMRLDLGFTCFSIFCVGSTVASLGIRSGDEASGFGLCRRLPKCLLADRILLLTVVLSVAFAAAFWVGVTIPVMSLRLQLHDLFAPKGPLPTEIMGIPIEPVLENLQVPEKANADVSLLVALSTLVSWIQQGEINSFIALIMIAGFVVSLTLLDMAVLVAAAVRHSCGRSTGALVALATILRKLAMLDVLIMGIVVVTLCMSMYQKDGIFVSMRSGVVALVCAELLHYVTYYAVLGACQPQPQHSPRAIEDGEGNVDGRLCLGHGLGGRVPSASAPMSQLEEFDCHSQDSSTPMLGPL